MPIKTPSPVVIMHNDTLYRSISTKQPPQIIAESKKTPKWYFDNLQYYLTFYNQRIGNIYFPSLVNTDQRPIQSQGSGGSSYGEYPVQKMIRMIMYYLGEQPNLNFNHLTPDVTTTNMQAQWIKGQEVSEYVNYFRGLMLSRISNAWFSAKNISSEAQSEREEMRKRLMLKLEMADYLKQLKEMGVDFSPANGKEFNYPEDVEKYMDEDYSTKERMAIVGENLANGIWFTNSWSSLALQSFMRMIITQLCAMEHSIVDGRSVQKMLEPFQLIKDTRIDDDYGRYDRFRGAVYNETPVSIISQYPELKPYATYIENMANNNALGKEYNNLAKNITWWVYGTNNARNTISVVKMYWKGIRDINKVVCKNKYGTDSLQPVSKEELSENILNDMHQCIVVGNKYLIRYGYVDNVVEDITDKANLEFPIQYFQPNTFMGQSVSEVARIARIQDELDMYDFKIREMVGKAKGKVYIIDGSKYGNGVTSKEFMEDVSSMGIHVSVPSGEVNEINDQRKGVEVIDWTLDPSIMQLAALYKERRDRMGKVMSTPDVAMGQKSQYVGLGTQRNAIEQSTLGIAYLMDGFMDFLVRNMYYAVNQLKAVKTLADEDEVEMLIGKTGLITINFTKDMSLSSLMISLNLNDVLDDKMKDRMLGIAQAAAQNQQISMYDFVKINNLNSLNEIERMLEYDLKKKEKANMESQKLQAQQQQMMAQQQSEILAMQEKMKIQAEQIIEIQKIDRKGEWEVRKAEVTAKLQVPNLAMEKPPDGGGGG